MNLRRLFFIVFLITTNAFSQCLCGDIEIRVYLPDVKFSCGESNYRMEVLKAPKWIPHQANTVLTKDRFINDTLALRFATQAGADILAIKLINMSNKREMELSFLNLYYDIVYFIDVGNFKTGNYAYDWKKIDKCQTLHKSNTLVDCNGDRFLQLQLREEESTSKFNHNKIKVIDALSFRQNSTMRKNIVVGTLEDYTVSFDCFGCTSTHSEFLVLYVKKDGAKTIMGKIDIRDFYVAEVALVTLNDQDFIYIDSSHTYGHSNGELFAFDIKSSNIRKVTLKDDRYKIPDSLTIHKGFGLSLGDDRSEFTTGYLLRSETNGKAYVLKTYYDLKRISELSFELVPTKSLLNEAD